MQTQKENKRFLSQSIDFNYKMLVRACKFSTLYMIKKYSQLQFLFEDPLKRHYRVKLGKQIFCSCHEGNLGHCMHSLYILIRIYKLPEQHKFVYQNSFTQQEIEQLIVLGKNVQQNSKNGNKIDKQVIKSEKQIAQVISSIKISIESDEKKEIKSGSIKSISQKEWPKFEEDTVCPICYDKIENQIPIIDCKGCKNYFHTKCLKVWVTQKRTQHADTSCPMCRRDFEQKVQQRIVMMDKYYIQYHQSYEINCNSCGKDILKKIYKCLLCQSYYLCSDCYYKWEHKNHDKFVGKESKLSQWGISERSEYNIKRLNANLEYFKKFGTSNGSEMKQLMGTNYEEFMSNYIKKPTLLEHALSAITDVQKQVHKTYKKLDFTEEDIICCLCKKKKIVGMRRMSCKHFIDEKCLKFVLQNSRRQCPIDKKYILPGFADINLKL